MGKILLFLIGIFAVIMLISFVISALHFLFYIALIAVIVVAALRLTGGVRRRRRVRS
jgi:TM2 domain-containing membrane protein YozV